MVVLAVVWLQAAPLEPLPAPLNSAVQVQQQLGGVYAAAVFSGVATPADAQKYSSNCCQRCRRRGCSLSTVAPGHWPGTMIFR